MLKTKERTGTQLKIYLHADKMTLQILRDSLNDFSNEFTGCRLNIETVIQERNESRLIETPEEINRRIQLEVNVWNVFFAESKVLIQLYHKYMAIMTTFVRATPTVEEKPLDLRNWVLQLEDLEECAKVIYDLVIVARDGFKASHLFAELKDMLALQDGMFDCYSDSYHLMLDCTLNLMETIMSACNRGSSTVVTME